MMALAGCSTPAVRPSESGPPAAAQLTGSLTVFAAASLTEVMAEFEAALETQNPALDVVVVLGGSSGLAQQLLAGAPADVFAAADETTMQTVVDGGIAAAPVPFAYNLLSLVVPAGNPAGVDDLDDLARPELLVALCAAEVPCGRASDQLLAEQGVVPAVDTREQDVRAVLTKVELGEVDAALVYVTDARAAGDRVVEVPITGAESVVTTLSAAILTGTARAEAAAAFMALLTSPEGQGTLRRAGFTVVLE